MTRGALLRIGVVLFACGCGLLTDGNVGRIIRDGTVVRSAEAGGYGGGGIAGMQGSGWGGSGGSAGRNAAGLERNPNAKAELAARGYYGPGAAAAWASHMPPGYYNTKTVAGNRPGVHGARRTIRRTGVYLATLPRGCIPTTMHGYSVWRC